MSDETTADSAASEATHGKQRNPVERVIVWGAIAVLFVVVLIEARAQYGYSQSLAAIQAAVEDPEEARVTRNQVLAMMAFGPAERAGEQTELVDQRVYSWLSLFKSGQFEITVDFSNDEEAQLLTFATAEAPEPEITDIGSSEGDVAEFDGDYDDGGEYLGGGGFPGGSGGGGFPGGGGFEPPADPLVAVLDADGDGEISTEEMEAAPDVLKTLDANSDGDLDLDEFASDIFGGRGGAGGGQPSESDRPQRPPLDE